MKMKKLLSFSLAMIMLLSCVFSQVVSVSAQGDVVDYNDAPYAGVYQVTSDKAVTLTNETGHTVTLAAGETDYFYLIKGNNNMTISDETAALTFTSLDNNGLDYIVTLRLAEFEIGIYLLAIQPVDKFPCRICHIEEGISIAPLE